MASVPCKMVSVDGVADEGFTAEELIDLARGQGFDISNRLLVDWVRRGLLDRPVKTGLGQGGGRGTAPGRWPDAQRQLLLALLKQRQTVHHVIPLCDLVVGTWLYFGDEVVPLRQARRALETWARFYRRGSRRRALKSAREFVGQIAPPSASRKNRQALVEVLATAGFRGRIERGEMVAALDRVLSLRDESPHTGPTAEVLADVISARFEGANRLDEVSDDVLRTVRSELNWFAQKAALDTKRLIGRACLDVIAGIGFRLLNPQLAKVVTDPEEVVERVGRP